MNAAIPNKNETQNYIVLAVIAATTAWAGNHGIDASTWASLVTSLAPIVIAGAAGLYSIVANWNQKKVPETATALELPTPPAPSATTINLAPLTGVAKVVGALLIGFLILHTLPVMAAERTSVVALSAAPLKFCDPLNLLPGCKQADGTPLSSVPQGTNPLDTLLQAIYNKLHDGGNLIIDDMNKAQAIASAKFADGTTADAPSAQCLAAAIPVAQLIVNNQLVPPGVTPSAAPATGSTTGSATTPASAGPDGIITAFVKVRVVVNALQSPALQSGCSWLQSSLNMAGTQGLASVLGGMVGLTKLGSLAVGL